MVNPTATENITTIKEARKLFNDVKSNLSNKEKKVIRRKLYKKEAASHFFKEREDDSTLTDRQRNVLRHIAIYSKNISKHLKNLRKNQKKSEKYGHDIDYLFNKKDSSNINAFQKGRILLNERRSSLLYSDINKIKKQLYKKEVVYAFLKNKERNGNLLEYHLHKISLNRGSSYIESPEWIKNKGVTINPKNTKDSNCFQYAIIAALNHQNIYHHPERISKLKPFINNYNWKEIEFPSHSKDWRKFECNNKLIDLNMLYVPYKIKQIRPAYKSKHNNERDTQVNLLMITYGTDNWHYLAVKSIPGLLRGITSNLNGDFSCLNCFHVYTTENKLRKHERICEDHDFCYVKMPDDGNNILEYVPGTKSLKVPFIIYTDLECLLQKINRCSNNLDKSYTEKNTMHKPSGYSIVTCCSFDKTGNEQRYYRGKDCMKKIL